MSGQSPVVVLGALGVLSREVPGQPRAYPAESGGQSGLMLQRVGRAAWGCFRGEVIGLVGRGLQDLRLKALMPHRGPSAHRDRGCCSL